MTDTATERRKLIVGRESMPILRLVVLEVNHDQTVEEMVAGYDGNNPNINSTNYPNCHAGKTGIESAEILLVQPVPGDGSASTDEVMKLIDEAGFVPSELPDVAVLKDDADELWAAGVKYVTALGENSRWRDPGDDDVCVPCLRLDPDDRGFGCCVGHEWDGDDWFVVRRKSKQ